MLCRLGSNLQISPRFGSLLGGTKVTVTGLCFDVETHPNITCRIGDRAYVTANVTSEKEFSCVTPIGVLLGRENFSIALDGVDFQYHTSFTYGK